MAIEWERGEELPDWRAAKVPERQIINGRYVRLEPIMVERQATDLFEAQAAGDPHLWDYMSAGPFETLSDVTYWLNQVALSPDPLFFTIVDQASGKAVGMESYLRITPAHGTIEIGFIWFGAALQRTPGATEAIYLLARHAFEDLGYRRLEWKCDSLNQRSRRAAERFGFTFEGIFRQHMVTKSRNRDTAWFAMLDSEWPVIKAAFEAWLAPDNFDAAGQQRRSLSGIRQSLQG
jgi:RimJ/RimL family protein N-acetyltransferase